VSWDECKEKIGEAPTGPWDFEIRIKSSKIAL
jgi:hypothetical protein